MDPGVQYRFKLSMFSEVFLTHYENSSHFSAFASGDSDLMHSFQWMGVASAVDMDGNDILSSFSLTDDYGRDWTQPVPAPSSLLAVVLPMGGLLASRRRR
jgi:hypothetical protein